MNVRELIEELQKIEDKELTVFVHDSSYWDCEVGRVLIKDDARLDIDLSITVRAVKID